MRPGSDVCRWNQKTTYTHFGGRIKIIELKGTFNTDGSLKVEDKYINNAKGWSSGQNIFLTWNTLKDNFHIVESTVIGDGHRSRTWTHTHCEKLTRGICMNGKFDGVTMIEEKKIK